MEELQRITTGHKIHYAQPANKTIIADPERINQVLINLISNAIKYSPQGGDIYIDRKTKAGFIEVSVRDQGIGISKEGQAKVFGRFFREHTKGANTYPGMGLGLYIAASIIQRHGGKIWVESELGKGTSFYFSLPLPK